MNAVSRRTALAFTAAGLTAALAPYAASAKVNNLAEVEAKISAHLKALRAADKLWSIHSNIEDANHIPVPSVQISKHLQGRNGDGTDNFTPIYAYSEHQIIKADAEWRETTLGLWGRTEAGRVRINAQYDGRLKERLADFRQQVADELAANDACGLTAAGERASAASDLVDDCLDALLDHPFKSLAELQSVSAHLINCIEGGEEGCDKETLARLVYAMAGCEVPEWRDV